MKRTLALSLVLSFPFFYGCVSRSAYQAEMYRMTEKLKEEKRDHAFDVKSLETKLSDKNKSLSELTNRYMEIEKQNQEFRKKLGYLRGDIEALLKDIAELKLVVFTNVKGSEGNEMMIKLIDMQQRLQGLLLKEKLEQESSLGNPG